MRENMFETGIQSLLQSFGGGASLLDGGHEVKKASNLKILGYYGTRTVISIFRILGNFNVSDGTATLPRNDKFSSRFTLHSSLNKRAAFTLAEVLITLGIIGVVAAITMPALMANYQKMVLRQQFKKAYNTVLNGYRLAEVNLGFHPMCYYGDDWIGAPCLKYENGICVEYGEQVNPTSQSSDCNTFLNELKNTLKVIKICEGNGVSDGCIPEYKGRDTIYVDNNPDATEEDINKATSGASGFNKTNINTKSHIWLLSDGTTIIWYGSAPTPKLFAVDINGMKGPNKWGYDFFPFILKSNLNKALWLEGYGSTVEKGGVSTSQMLKDMGR